MGFECCGTSKKRNTRKSGPWVKLLNTAKDLTCKIVFFWHIILCEERAFEIVHKEKSRDKDRSQTIDEDIARIESYWA